MENNIISAEFSHFRHIKTRKVVVLECEIAEELFQDAIAKLGMPIGGESKPVAIALLDKTAIKPETIDLRPKDQREQTEGERLRTRAVLLCKDESFFTYAMLLNGNGVYSKEDAELWSKKLIYSYCGIGSRSELATNLAAQQRLKELLAKYDAWKLEQQYSDNLGRV